MRALFDWLDAHPGSYWFPVVGATLLLLGWILRGWSGADRGARAERWAFPVILLLFLLAWRWPFLFCAHEYNPDESQFLAGAMTLTHDPVFWRSVDGTTSGPLNFYVLIPAHWLGLRFDYFTARLVGLALSWGTLVLLHRLLRSRGPARAAELAVLPAAAFFAAAAEPDFNHYSSELLPLALLALALHWLERRPLAAAFVAGLLPWAKLQALPLGAVVGLWLFGLAWRSAGGGPRVPVRRWAQLTAAAALPAVLIIGGVAVAGEFDAFFHRYVLQNIVYVDEGVSRRELIRLFWQESAKTHHFQAWALGMLALLAATGLGYARARRRPAGLCWLGLALLATAVASVLAPGRPSLHYLHFLLVPATVALGAAWAELWPAGRARVATLAVAALALSPLAVGASRGVPEMFGRFALHWRQPYSPLGSVLRHWREPGARLAVWGWMNSAYVESGLPQGTRDVLTVWSVHDTAERDYYRATYLADLQRSRAELFVDATGVGAPFLDDRTRQGHENFRALADYVREHYTLVADITPARVFVRNDVLARHPITRRELQRRLDRGRPHNGFPEPAGRVLPGPAVYSEVDHHAVQMLESPTRVEWPLAGTERAVVVAFGFHPRAYTEGRSDGADFIVELQPAGEPPLEIFRRHLDPARAPADRGPQQARIPLPPFAPGARLVVRSAPGPVGDTAWDWVYLDQLNLVRNPFYLAEQFPGFPRRPDRVQSAYPSLLESGPRRVLELPPPSELTFDLDGTEQWLAMSFGLLEGAYQDQGRTDGAVFEVEWRSAAGARRTLFSRRLNPVVDPGDRGPQHADLRLPEGIHAGDELVVRIGAGGTTSWDWTYVSGLDLR